MHGLSNGGTAQMLLPMVPLPRVDVEKELMRCKKQAGQMQQQPAPELRLPQAPVPPAGLNGHHTGVSLSESARERWMSSFGGGEAKTEAAKPMQRFNQASKNFQAVSLPAVPRETTSTISAGAAVVAFQPPQSHLTQAAFFSPANSVAFHNSADHSSQRKQQAVAYQQQQQQQPQPYQAHQVHLGHVLVHQPQSQGYHPHQQQQQYLLPLEPLPHSALSSTQTWRAAQQQVPRSVLAGFQSWSPTAMPQTTTTQHQQLQMAVNTHHPHQHQHPPSHQSASGWISNPPHPQTQQQGHQGYNQVQLQQQEPVDHQQLSHQQQMLSHHKSSSPPCTGRNSGDIGITTSLTVLCPNWRPPQTTVVLPDSQAWRAEGSVNLSTESMKIKLSTPALGIKKFVLPFQHIFSARQQHSSENVLAQQLSRGPADLADWRLDMALHLSEEREGGRVVKAAVMDPWKRPYLVSIPLIVQQQRQM